VYCVLCTVYCVLCTVYCVLCTVYCVLCTVYCVLCTYVCNIYSELCAVLPHPPPKLHTHLLPRSLISGLRAFCPACLCCCRYFRVVSLRFQKPLLRLRKRAFEIYSSHTNAHANAHAHTPAYVTEMQPGSVGTDVASRSHRARLVHKPAVHSHMHTHTRTHTSHQHLFIQPGSFGTDVATPSHRAWRGQVGISRCCHIALAVSRCALSGCAGVCAFVCVCFVCLCVCVFVFVFLCVCAVFVWSSVLYVGTYHCSRFLFCFVCCCSLMFSDFSSAARMNIP
jgi:hypothetical protein